MRKPATLCVALIAALAVWEIAVLWRAKAKAPANRDWAAAHDLVAAAHQAGDLIVFAPAWTDPVGRKWLGDMMTVAEAARMDAVRYPRVWEVSIRGAHSAEATGTVAVDQTFGAVRVRRFDRVAAAVTWDLGDQAQLREVDFAPRNCVPFKPPHQLDLPQVALGSSLAVYAGIADFRSRRDNQARALLTVKVDDLEVARATVGNDSGWLALPVAATTPGPHHVVFDASLIPGTGNGNSLDLCIAAEARQ